MAAPPSRKRQCHFDDDGGGRGVDPTEWTAYSRQHPPQGH